MPEPYAGMRVFSSSELYGGYSPPPTPTGYYLAGQSGHIYEFRQIEPAITDKDAIAVAVSVALNGKFQGFQADRLKQRGVYTVEQAFNFVGGDIGITHFILQQLTTSNYYGYSVPANIQKALIARGISQDVIQGIIAVKQLQQRARDKNTAADALIKRLESGIKYTIKAKITLIVAFHKFWD